MKVKLIRAARVLLQPGEVVDVPETVANFLCGTRSAEPVVTVTACEKATTTTKAKATKGKGK